MSAATTEAARIGALLTGRSAPRERIARALAAYLAPLRAAPLGELLGEVRIVPLGEDDARPEGRWARLGRQGRQGRQERPGETTFLHVPARAAAVMGTVMLGGSPDALDRAGDDDDDGDGDGDGATPVDWHLAALVVDALGSALSPPLAHASWCEDEPDMADGAAGTLRIELGGGTHALAMRVPVSALSIRAPETASDAPSSDASDRPRRDPRRSASIAATATLDMAPRSLRAALAIRTGDVLPLDGSLGAITVRADGRAVLTGALGHAGGHLCLRVIERAAEPDFAALADAAVPTAGTSDATTQTTAGGRPVDTTPTDDATAMPERRSAM